LPKDRLRTLFLQQFKAYPLDIPSMAKKALASLLLSFSVYTAAGQTTYLQLNSEDYHLLDRLETRSGELTNSFFTSIKPIPRNGAVEFLLEKRKNAREMNLSLIDRHNIDKAISTSGEWTPDENGAIDSRLPWFNTFYRKQPDFVHVKTKNFFLVVNPVISAQAMYERTGNGSDNKFWSSRGVELRGWIAKKIGFYSYVTDNQETVPEFVNDWVTKHQAVPGADYYMTPSGGSHYDYLQARGYIDFAAVKNHVNVTFGYDKHFLGDGIRSLYLSDFAAGATFLRLNTKIWKLNYQNLYMELTPQYFRGTDRELPHKYATMHTLSINATKWLNIGVYESVMFSRQDRYEFGYMIPIIFYRAIERGLGSPDNVNLGINFKAIAAKHLQFYGQLMLDEFKAKELFSNRGWWGNKYGIQLGGKYFDAAGIRNLDLQAEVNMVRPYTYSHYDSTSNYSHYNQPLAHPVGSGFREVLGMIRYQPVKNLFIALKGMYYQQGSDPDSLNYGNDIFKNYRSRPADQEFGVEMINGPRVTSTMLNLNLAYELKENLFIDLGATRRVYKYENAVMPNHVTNYVYGGLRLNIARRDYDFY